MRVVRCLVAIAALANVAGHAEGSGWFQDSYVGLTESVPASESKTATRTVEFRSNELYPLWEQLSPSNERIFMTALLSYWAKLEDSAVQEYPNLYADASDPRRNDAIQKIRTYYEAARLCWRNNEVNFRVTMLKYVSTVSRIEECMKPVAIPTFDVSTRPAPAPAPAAAVIATPVTMVPPAPAVVVERPQVAPMLVVPSFSLPPVPPMTTEPTMVIPVPPSISTPMAVDYAWSSIIAATRAPETEVPLQTDNDMWIQSLIYDDSNQPTAMDNDDGDLPINARTESMRVTSGMTRPFSKTWSNTKRLIKPPFHSSTSRPKPSSPIDDLFAPFYASAARLSPIDANRNGLVTAEEWTKYVSASQYAATRVVERIRDPMAKQLLRVQLQFHYGTLARCIQRQPTAIGAVREAVARVKANCMIKLRYTLLGGPPPFEIVAGDATRVTVDIIQRWYHTNVAMAQQEIALGNVPAAPTAIEELRQADKCVDVVLERYDSKTLFKRDAFYELLNAIEDCMDPGQ